MTDTDRCFKGRSLLRDVVLCVVILTQSIDSGASHMARLNREEPGAAITVYHSFGDEVDHYRTHIWRCNGVCRTQHPFFGYVRRSMNRAPGPSDSWHAAHAATCGGAFVKEAEPLEYTLKKMKKLKKKEDIKSSADIKLDVNRIGKREAGKEGVEQGVKDSRRVGSSGVVSAADGHSPLLSESASSYQRQLMERRERLRNRILCESGAKEMVAASGDTAQPHRTTAAQVAGSGFEFMSCPICCQDVMLSRIHDHVEACLSDSAAAVPVIDLISDSD